MLIKILTVVLIAFSTQFAFAQTSNVCSSVAMDPEGDGYGWENQASCRVTEQSAPKPEFTNQETGQGVSLTRAYWNAVDFDKDIACDIRHFDGSAYISIHTEVLFQFGALSSVIPFEGTVSVVQPYVDRTNNMPWSLDNGIYSGPSGLGYSPWVEIVDLDYGTGGGIAVRIWMTDESFTQCRSINPYQSFFPTGMVQAQDDANVGGCVDTDPVGDGWGWDGSASCRVTADTVCIDTDPVGDGWGWDGSESCRVR